MDWKIIIASIQNAGLSQTDIAKICGCKQNTISYLLTGKSADTTHRIGSALVALSVSLKAKTPRKTINRLNKNG